MSIDQWECFLCLGFLHLVKFPKRQLGETIRTSHHTCKSQLNYNMWRLPQLFGLFCSRGEYESPDQQLS